MQRAWWSINKFWKFPKQIGDEDKFWNKKTSTFEPLMTFRWRDIEEPVKTSVNVQWITGMGAYCWHYGYWPMSECRTPRQNKGECAMDIWHVIGLLAIRELVREWVQHHPSRLVWMCNGYTASDSIVGTTGTDPWVILKENVLKRNQKRNREKFPNGCNAKRGIAAARDKQYEKGRRGIAAADLKMNQIEQDSPLHVKNKRKI